MGRAFAAIASDCTLPPLQIVESTRNADGRWINQEPLGQPERVITPEAALRVMRAAQTYQNGVRGFSFSALTGPGGQRSSWFIGRDSEGQVLVILLEQGNTIQVERIASEFFQNLASIQSPLPTLYSRLESFVVGLRGTIPAGRLLWKCSPIGGLCVG